MKIIDIVLSVFILFGAYKGYQKGLIMEIIQLLALVVATILGLKLYEIGMHYLRPSLGEAGGFLPYISFFIIFIGVIILVNLVGKSLKHLAKLVFLGWLDKLTGAFFGGLKWAFGLSVLVWFLHKYHISPREEVIKETLVYEPLLKLAPRVIDWVGVAIPFFKNLLESI